MSGETFTLRPLDGSGGVIEASGEIDAANAPAFREALEGITGSGEVILDLSAVEYLDSAGFDVLDQMLARGNLALVLSPTSIIRKAASLMNVAFHDSVEAARAAVGAV